LETQDYQTLILLRNPKEERIALINEDGEQRTTCHHPTRRTKMTLHTNTSFTIPEETIRVAHAAYPHGNIYLQMREVLGPIYHDQAFAHLFPHNGRPVEAPWRLAIITVMQYAEELSDRQAADAVRGRIDWKYMLGQALMPRSYPPFASGSCKATPNTFS
jgi:hypothetical protein